MRITPLRNNFNGGEISPRLDLRGEIDKYKSGCLTLENFIPLVEGGVARAPGTQYIGGVKDSSVRTRLIPFRFSTIQAYVLEFGDQYIRVYKDKARIDAVEITSPYLEEDLAGIKTIQSADVLYIFHRSYPPAKLSRLSHTSWVLNTITFSPPPTYEAGHEPLAAITPGATSGEDVPFTASASAFLESDIGRVILSGASRAIITDYTSATSVTCDILDAFTSTAEILAGDWSLQFSPISSLTMTNKHKGASCYLTAGDSTLPFTNLLKANTSYWILSAGGTNEYYLDPTVPVHPTVEPGMVYIGGVAAIKATLGSLGVSQYGWGDNDSLGADTIYVRMPAVVGSEDPDVRATAIWGTDVDYVKMTEAAGPFGVWRAEDVGKYVYINGGIIKLNKIVTTYKARGEVLQELVNRVETENWTLESELWSSDLGYPACGFFFEQRLWMAANQILNGSVSGDYENFSRGADDDQAVQYTLSSNQVEIINWMAGNDFLMLGTSGGIWRVGATTSTDPITPTNIQVRKQGSAAAHDSAPVPVTDSLLWLDYSGQRVNRMDYSLEKDKYEAVNLSRIASHMGRGGFGELAFQQTPVPIFWAVRADGQLAGLTYESQENIYGWFRVVTDGLFESVAVISNEGGEDEVWVIINRSGQRMVEVLAPFDFGDDISDAFFVHSGVTFDGGAPMEITDFKQSSPAVLYAVNTLTGGEHIRVAGVIGMEEANGVWPVSSATPGEITLSGIDSTGWRHYQGGGTASVVKQTFTTGLDHLEGREVAILADGAVHPRRVVAGGAITLQWPGNKVHVGLPYTSVLRPTKPHIDLPQGVSRGRKQRISDIFISLLDSWSGKYGPSLSKLLSLKFPVTGPTMFEGEINAPMDGATGTGADLYIVQDLPLPMTVRGVTYGLDFED